MNKAFFPGKRKQEPCRRGGRVREGKEVAVSRYSEKGDKHVGARVGEEGRETPNALFNLYF